MKQYPLPLPHRETMDTDDFMVTTSNREAIAWLDRWPGWPSHCVVIHGPPGSGKTHLMKVWLARSGGKIITAGELAARDAETLTQDGRIVAIDDADKIAGSAAGEEALFHLYNFLREAKGFLLLTAARSPAQWGINLPDLRSRLAASPAAGLAAPDDELLAALLVKQFHDRQITVDPGVVAYLLPRIARDPASVRAVAAELDRLALAEGRRVTVALARRLLEEQKQLFEAEI